MVDAFLTYYILWQLKYVFLTFDKLPALLLCLDCWLWTYSVYYRSRHQEVFPNVCTKTVQIIPKKSGVKEFCSNKTASLQNVVWLENNFHDGVYRNFILQSNHSVEHRTAPAAIIEILKTLLNYCNKNEW